MWQVALGQQETPVLKAKPAQKQKPAVRVDTTQQKRKGATASAAATEQALEALQAGNYRWTLQGNLFIGIPRGEFRENNTRAGGGIEGKLLYHFPQLPVHVGLGVAYVTYGISRRHVPLSLTIPDVTVEVERTNNYMIIDPELRLEGLWGRLMVYAALGAGVTYLFTETKVKDWESDKEVVSSTNYQDWTWNWWSGGGIGIVLYSGEYGSNTWSSSPLVLQMGFRWLSGGAAEYLTPGDVDVDLGTVQYTVRRSRTDLFVLIIGLMLRG